MTESHTAQDRTERPPATVAETVLANCRPQPAIPAVLVMIVFVLMPTLGASADSSWRALVIAAGTIVSCGLAIAAGFCSLFPPLAWIVLALWCSSLPAFASLPGYNPALLAAAGVCAAAMLGTQIWRIRTGRFIPTIRVYPDERE